jgi:hypothetical protein
MLEPSAPKANMAEVLVPLPTVKSPLAALATAFDLALVIYSSFSQFLSQVFHYSATVASSFQSWIELSQEYPKPISIDLLFVLIICLILTLQE